MKVIVDRIENDIIVCEKSSGEMINILLSEVEKMPKEGDILEYKDEKWIILVSASVDRKKYIDNLTKDMWKN